MCVYIITLSTNNCKMYLLDSLKKKSKKKSNIGMLHAEHVKIRLQSVSVKDPLWLLYSFVL